MARLVDSFPAWVVELVAHAGVTVAATTIAAIGRYGRGSKLLHVTRRPRDRMVGGDQRDRQRIHAMHDRAARGHVDMSNRHIHTSAVMRTCLACGRPFAYRPGDDGRRGNYFGKGALRHYCRGPQRETENGTTILPDPQRSTYRRA